MDVRALLTANDARLRALYGGEVPAARYESLADAFRAHFSREPQAFVSAPGARRSSATTPTTTSAACWRRRWTWTP